jgi:deoxyadenosine/deoxycytidine kinase
MRVAIVGPCATGKTALAYRLRMLGFDADDVAQEHSHVQTMWREIARPDVLIYLDASLPTIRARLHVDWEQDYLDELHLRLADARAHAHFVLATDHLTEEGVCERVVDFLHSM